ncbi:hypothetical protein DdX_12682 [Ditylenchus destructor]|uniref:Uncharacterized protein n=1 Tax=Ditylenchus destructor TaxID=166010 RepID=A0AAD4R3B4_9BILA|nr:hypothetical protein DdX_12682 [Ditylenchus destructor]
MLRLYNLLAAILFIDLCTISVMAGWSCGWHDGTGPIEWAVGQAAYVLEYRNGSFICNVLYDLESIFGLSRPKFLKSNFELEQDRPVPSCQPQDQPAITDIVQRSKNKIAASKLYSRNMIRDLKSRMSWTWQTRSPQPLYRRRVPQAVVPR